MANKKDNPRQATLAGIEVVVKEMTKRQRELLIKLNTKIATLPVISRSDPTIRLIGRLPLPTKEEVTELIAKKSGLIGIICQIWAIHVGADLHVQTPSGQRFDGPDGDEMARYAPIIPAFWDSKSDAGGAAQLSYRGYNSMMYGGTAHLNKVPFDPKQHLFTNDGLRGNGYRFIASGKELLAYYRLLLEKLPPGRLKIDMQERLRSALKAPKDFLQKTEMPSHHKMAVTLTYSYIRRSTGTGHGRLTVNFPSKPSVEFQKLFDAFGPDRVNWQFKALLDANNVLTLTPDSKGWQVTDGWSINITTLDTANIPQPPNKSNVYIVRKEGEKKKDSDDDFIVHMNVPVRTVDGSLQCDIPADLFEYTLFDLTMGMSPRIRNNGLRTKDSHGSTKGRAKTLLDTKPNMIVTDHADEMIVPVIVPSIVPVAPVAPVPFVSPLLRRDNQLGA